MIWIVDLQPYKSSISFRKDIGDAFNDCRDVYWESRLRQINILTKQGKQKEVEELMEDDEIYAYFQNIENKYFPDYFKKKSRSNRANNLLNILENEREKAKRLNQSLMGYSLSEEYKNQLQESKDKHLDYKYLLMIWKHKHNRWKHAKSPLFFDIGDEYVYQSIENIQFGNGLIVKKHSKERFVSFYKNRQETSRK